MARTDDTAIGISMAQSIEAQLADLRETNSLLKNDFRHLRTDVSELVASYGKIADAMQAIAIQGEQVTFLRRDVDRLYEEVKAVTGRVGAMEGQIDNNSEYRRWLNRITAGLIVGVGGAVITGLFVVFRP